MAAAGYEPRRRPDRRDGTEDYEQLAENPFVRVAADPLSTFSIDVDTASYANVRRFLNDGTMPPKDAVRIEELVNYFRFNYPQPTGDAPFSITTELAECPWNPTHRLALIGLQGREIVEKETPARNLVFLVDVSGSMQSPTSCRWSNTACGCSPTCSPTRIASPSSSMRARAGWCCRRLPAIASRESIARIEGLEAGGSTNGGAGIRLAYHIARENFIKGGVNRVILATDGDFNVGVTSQEELVSLIEKERESGVFLSVLGVGTGNLKDSTMEKLADKGNGNYAYLDSLHEARKVLVKEAGSTLVTIAKDVKIQVEFNPKNVNGYRLIGYENRMLANQDFNDDKKDAGEIGAGHSVTAIYEIVPAGVEIENVDPLKYCRAGCGAGQAAGGQSRVCQRARDREAALQGAGWQHQPSCVDGDCRSRAAAYRQPRLRIVGGGSRHAAARLEAGGQWQLRIGDRAGPQVQGRRSRRLSVRVHQAGRAGLGPQGTITRMTRRACSSRTTDRPSHPGAWRTTFRPHYPSNGTGL